jgi:hypothetical protein
VSETLEADHATEPGLHRRAIVFAALVFIGLRLAVSLLGLTVGTISANGVPPYPGTAPPATSGLHNLWDGTDRLDAAWFMLIADEGYDTQPGRAAAFFPGYPLAIRVVSAIPGVDTLVAEQLISNLAAVGSFFFLYLLTTEEVSESAARRSVLVLAAFPTSFFLVAPYSESLYLFAVLGSFLAARRGRWVLAGSAGAVAGATRQIGIVVWPALLLVVRRTGRTRRAALSVSVAVLGPVLYLAWWQVHAGDALAPLHAQASWGREAGFPLTTLAHGLYLAWSTASAPDWGYWTSDALLTIVGIAGVVTIARKVPGAYVAFALMSIVVPLCYPYPGRDLLSMSRFLIVIFPAFWGMSAWLRRGWQLGAWLAVSIPLAAWHAILFMHYRHVY